jgi:hypothetical protein
MQEVRVMDLWVTYRTRYPDLLANAHQARLAAEARSVLGGGSSTFRTARRLGGIALIRLGQRLQGAQCPTTMELA